MDLEKMEALSSGRIESEYRNALASNGTQIQSLDVLVLSGGGGFGAFGAGFLEGWGKISNNEFARPEFDSVSGISTGALIAPFAFIGTPEAYRKIVQIYQNPGSDWVRKRWIIPYLPGNVSVFDVSNLKAKINETITPSLIGALAKGSAEGRQLVVGATNLDYGLMRVWDLARIAREIPVKAAIKQTVSILMASAAIPGAFPPVILDDFLYVDGGAAMQVVGGTDNRQWVYAADQQHLNFVKPGLPIKIRVWIIVNNKLLPESSVVKPRWTSIATRSLSTLLRISTLQSIQDTETYIHLIDKLETFDAEFRYVSIPQEFPIDNSDEMFHTETMQKLVELGRKMGADSTSWETEALRSGAPFKIPDSRK